MPVKNVNLYKGITVERVYTCFVGLYPILNRYASPLPMLSLSEFVILPFLVLGISRYRERPGRAPVAMLIFMLYLLFHMVRDFISVDLPYLSDSIGTTFRLLFIYTALIFASKSLFIPSYAERVYPVMGTVVALYGFLQIVVAQVNIVLPSYIPGLPIMGSFDVDQAVEQRLELGFRFRCQSLLNEPAALATYLTASIIMCLFPHRYSRERYGIAGIMSTVVFLSQSSTGIIMMGLLWIAKLIVWMRSRRFDARFLVLVLFVSIITFYIIFIPTGIFETFLQHTFSRYGSSGLFQNSRFHELGMAISESDSISKILFGVGMQSTEFYLPGFARAYYCLGAVGLLLVCGYLFALLRSGFLQNRIIVTCFIVLNFGTEILFGNFVIYYLSTCMADLCLPASK